MTDLIDKETEITIDETQTCPCCHQTFTLSTESMIELFNRIKLRYGERKNTGKVTTTLMYDIIPCPYCRKIIGIYPNKYTNIC